MTLDELYASIPPVPCVPGCTDCCGPITMLPAEWERLGRPDAEALRLRRGNLVEVRKDARGTLIGSGDVLAAQRDAAGRLTGDCLFAKEDGCEVYENRPFICRLYATCFQMPCRHGCHSHPQLPRARVRELTDEYRRMGVAP